MLRSGGLHRVNEDPMNDRSPQPHSLATTHPRLAEEWDPERNGDLTSSDVNAFSRKVVSWRCRSRHGWTAPVDHRRAGAGCPLCSPLTSRSGHGTDN